MAEELNLFDGIDFSSISIENQLPGVEISSAPPTTITSGETTQINISESDKNNKLAEELDGVDFTENSEAEESNEDNVSHGKGKNNEDTPEISSVENSSSSPIADFAKFLNTNGVFSKFDESRFGKDANIETLAEAINEEADERVQGFIDNLPEPLKDVINNYVDGVPLDEIIGVKSRQIEINNIKPEHLEQNTELAKNIARQHLTATTSFSEKKIEKLIQEWDDTGKLTEEAIESLGELQEIYKQEEVKVKERAAQEQKRQEELRVQQLNAIKQTLEKTEEIIPGMKLNKVVREKVEKSMTTPVGVDKSGKPINAVQATRMKNPLAFEQAMHYYHSLGLFNIDDKGNFKPDFSKIKATEKSNAVKDLETNLFKMTQSASSYTPGKPAVNDDNKTNKNDIDAVLNGDWSQLFK